jgi:hypothetical protein
MAEWHHYDDEFLIEGPVRILMAVRADTSYADQLSDIISKTTYDPVSPWFDVGHTATPFELSTGFDTVEAESQQAGVIDMGVGNWTHMARTSFMEESETIRTVLGHAAATENADGERAQQMINQDYVTEYRIAALKLNVTSGKIEGELIHKAKWSGSDSTSAWGRGDIKNRPIEWRCFPDEDAPNNAVYTHIWEP